MLFYKLFFVTLVAISCMRWVVAKKPVGCYGNLCKSGPKKYPMNKIKKLLQETKQIKIKTEKPTVIEPTDTNVNKAILLRNVGSTERNLCETRQITVFPRFDKEKELTIVNIKKVYEQSVTYELCGLRNSSRCLQAGVHHSPAFCKQLYSNVRLLYVDDGGTLKYNLFQVPTACVCVYMDNIRKYGDKES